MTPPTQPDESDRKLADSIAELFSEGKDGFAMLRASVHNLISTARASDRERIAELERAKQMLCQDWAEDDNFVDKVLEKHGIKMWGDSYGMPCIQDKVEELDKRLTLATTALEAAERALNDGEVITFEGGLCKANNAEMVDEALTLIADFKKFQSPSSNP